MSKYSGVIGFATPAEIAPGVWEDQIIEKRYRGDILQNIRRWQEGDKINSDFVLNNSVSILADTYLYNHIPNIKYVEWLGSRWKVSSATVTRPRIVMTIGDVYNGPTS